MKLAIKAALAAAAGCAFAAPAFAYTLTGTVPAGTTIVLHLQPYPLPGLAKFTMSAPAVNAGVAYALDYCTAPAGAAPCSDWDASVAAGATVIRTVPTYMLQNKVFTVGQGTRQ